jgi:SAM-dependent methyltransferase
MSGGDPRVTDYSGVADRFDRRYGLLRYDGVHETLRSFLDPAVTAALEVGCGTGHWLQAASGRAAFLAGVDPSAAMLARAGKGAYALVQARAEALPWRDASFDRVFCINALHHFADRAQFFAEAVRVLRPGGALLSIGKDPHTGRDDWWVYDYFDETRAIDLARFAPVRILRGEMALAGFTSAESFEADRIEAVRSAADAFTSGMIDRAFTSQLTVLSDEEFERGVARIRRAQADAAASGGELMLVSDFRLFATVGRL